MKEISIFLSISQRIGREQLHTQGPGGNISVKIRDLMYVKASGYMLKELKRGIGYIGCYYQDIAEKLRSINTPSETPDVLLDAAIEQCTLPSSKGYSGSIETAMHAVLPSRYVIHTHTIYTNIFACMDGGHKELRRVLNQEFLFIPYANPGYYLARSLQRRIARCLRIPSLLVLENHGIIIHHDDPYKAMRILGHITDEAQRFLASKHIKPFSSSITRAPGSERHLFPDSVVCEGIEASLMPARKRKAYFEIIAANNYIQEVIVCLGGLPKFLSRADSEYIKNMEKEKARKKMLTEKIYI